MAESTPLHERTPVELPKGTPTLTEEQAAEFDAQLDDGWERDRTSALRRRFEFPDFNAAFAFATRVALVAERFFHHPDMAVGWGYVEVTFTTHSIGGLGEGDYIMAARIDRFA